MEFEGMLDRFFRYVGIDTQSDENSETFPSTKKQFNLARVLVDDLEQLGLDDVKLNERGYVFATLPKNCESDTPTIAFIAHMDTSPDVSGKDVSPKVTENYNGEDVVLDEKGDIVLSVKENPYLKTKKGNTLITTDGSTLLGADNKAGITEIMEAVKYLIAHPEIPRPRIRILFTPDEEIGKGVNHVTKAEIDAEYGYTIDGEKLGELEDETFCADTAVVKIEGVNVHPGYAKNKLVNAIKIAADLIHRLPKESLSPETTEKREGYLHPYTISGGGESCELKLLVRDFEESGLAEKERFLESVVEEVKTAYPKSKISCEIVQSYRNMKVVLDKHPKVTDLAMKAIEKAGITPNKSIIRGGTDGARLSFMGIPTPNIFTGGSNFHSKYEWITLEDMKKASEVIVNLAELWSEVDHA